MDTIRRASSKCEEHTENVARRTKKILPTIGRMLLISTFVEDGFRLFFYFNDHSSHFSAVWNLNYYFSVFLTTILLINLLVGSLFVMLRIKVLGSSICLGVTIMVQVVLYQLYSTYHLMCRNISILAALMLLVTEDMLRNKPKQQFMQLPKDESDIEVTSIMLIACRLFLNLMLASMIHFDMAYGRLLICLISYSMMVAVWCGYKTRMMSLLLATWLFAFNVLLNDFWNRGGGSHVTRYDFFQALSAVGALLLLVHTGPGELSIDEYKKKW